jgi:hypothetical protein
MAWTKSARSQGVTAENRDCGVAPLGRSAAARKRWRGAPCIHGFPPVTRFTDNYEIGSSKTLGKNHFRWSNLGEWYWNRIKL